MHDAVLDTSPLIHLHEIDCRDLVTAVFRNIYIPEHVESEIRNEPILQFIHLHPDQIKVLKNPESELFSTKNAYSTYQLHLADLAVLNLLTKIVDAVAVTDDLALRKAIESSGRTAVGTIGIIFRAFKLDVIDQSQLKDIVDRIFNDSTLYLNSAFRARVLAMVELLK